MLSEKPVITIAKITDAAALRDVTIKTFCETFAAFNKPEDMEQYLAGEMNLAKITAELGDKENLFILAKDDEDITAYAKISDKGKPELLSDKRTLEIARIYVLKEYHHKKIGAAVMQYCIDYARGKQCDTVWLGVWEHNEKAINFYKRWGFEIFGSHIFRLGNDDQTDLLMKKELAADS